MGGSSGVSRFLGFLHSASLSWSLLELVDKQTVLHSPMVFAIPRMLKALKPSAFFSHPKTGGDVYSLSVPRPPALAFEFPLHPRCRQRIEVVFAATARIRP